MITSQPPISTALFQTPRWQPPDNRATRALLHRRLQISSGLATLTLATLLVFFNNHIAQGPLIDMVGIGWLTALFAHLWLFSAGIAFLWLSYRESFSIKTLRRLELTGVSLSAVFLALWQIDKFQWAIAADDADRMVISVHFHSLLTWVILIVMYGVFIPNHFRRAAFVVATFALVSLLLSVGLAASNPISQHLLPAVSVSTLSVLCVAVSTALFGTYRIEALSREAEEARQEMREWGQYKLIRRIGAGGMGEVYLAEHRLLKRPCALKLLGLQWSNDMEFLRRFEREAHAMAQLKHPNAVEVYDYGRSDNSSLYYVMEYLEGLSLQELVNRHGPLPPARMIHVMRQVTAALREAHRVGLVHRDIKPGNVMICPGGFVHDAVKLLDFGVVSTRGLDGAEATRLTANGMVVGTPDYMAPEQAEGHSADPRSDLYSLGAMGYFLLTGRPPFIADCVVRLLMAQINDQAIPPSERNPEVPPELDEIVLRCLEKDPTRRFADAAELERALVACECRWSLEQAETWWADHPLEVP